MTLQVGREDSPCCPAGDLPSGARGRAALPSRALCQLRYLCVHAWMRRDAQVARKRMDAFPGVQSLCLTLKPCPAAGHRRPGEPRVWFLTEVCGWQQRGSLVLGDPGETLTPNGLAAQKFRCVGWGFF